MKRISLLLIAATISFASQAQKVLPFCFGPMAGMNSMNLQSSPSFDEVNPGSGYAVGAFFRLNLKKWYVQPEAYYTQKNCVLTNYPSPGVQNSVHVNLKSTDVDLLVGHKLIKLSDLAYFRIFAGPGMSFFHGSDFKLNGQNYSSADLSNSSVNGSAGLGLDLLKFSFDLRYQRGFTDLNKTDDATLYTNTVLFTAAWKIL